MRTRSTVTALVLMASLLLLSTPRLNADPVQAPSVSTETHKAERIAKEENAKEKQRPHPGPSLRIKEPPSPKTDKPSKPPKTDKPAKAPKTDQPAKAQKTEKPAKPPKADR